MEELVKEQPVYEIQKVKIKNNQLTAEYPPRSTVRVEPA